MLLLVFVFGAAFAPRVPIERFPAEAVVAVLVAAELPGFDAAAVEAMVAQPLERALAGMAGLQRYETVSRYGSARIRLLFAAESGAASVLEAARRRVLQTYSSLPVGIDVPTVAVQEREALPGVIYRIRTPALSQEVVDWVTHILLDPLRELPEVASVEIEGVAPEEILIEPDLRRLAGLGLSIDDLISALRQADVAPRRPRRDSTRAIVILPTGAEAIAARAVRLPSGEPLALAELARVSIVSPEPASTRRDRGAPLIATVTARSPAHAQLVAERAAAHVGWLRANGVVPGGVALEPLHDEARAARAWRREVLGHAGLAVLPLLALVVLAFDRRILVVALVASAVWWPGALAVAGALGFALNANTAAYLLLAYLPFLLMTLLPASATGLVIVVGVAFVCLASGLALVADIEAAAVFGAALALGLVVRWLMQPWARPQVGAVLARGRRVRRVMAALALVLIAQVAVLGGAYAVLGLHSGQGAWRLLVVGDDPRRLAELAQGLLPALHAIGRVSDIAVSSATEETWRLHLDAERLAQATLTPATVGRALAVASGGMRVGEVVSAEARLPLRLRLSPGAAGDSFERLLLRGERGGRPAIYLRDVGLAERVEQWRERWRVNGVPAIEIRAQWEGDAAREALKRFCQRIDLPPGYEAKCAVRDAPVPRSFSVS